MKRERKRHSHSTQMINSSKVVNGWTENILNSTVADPSTSTPHGAQPGSRNYVILGWHPCGTVVDAHVNR